MRRLVILRPEPGASASVAAARALGLDAIAMPLFEACPVDWVAPDPEDFDAILLTSANAVRHGATQLGNFHHLPVHAVGQATADAARAAGFAEVDAGGGDVAALLGMLPRSLRLFHPCGRDRRAVDTTRTITAVPVYMSFILPCPAGFAVIADAVVAVHSPRAGARLAELADAASLERDRIRIAAISAAAASAVGEGWHSVTSAAAPNDRALLELAARLCKKARAS